MNRSALLAFIALDVWAGMWACSTSTPTPSSAETSEAAPTAPPSASSAPSSNEGAVAEISPPPSASVSPASPPVFTPPKVVIPSERSAAPEDGQWKPWPAGQTTLYRTTVHPHPTSRFKRLDVVAIDLRTVELHWVPGTLDDERDVWPDESSLGLLPEARHEAALLLFNGGFQPRHGRWGLSSGQVILQNPKPEGCVVAVTRSSGDPSVVIGPWSRFGTGPESFEFVRQTPPCLLEQGAISPALLAGRDKPFGGNDPNLKTRRRSALGIDASGGVLFYALGTETEPIDLARGLGAVGASDALQLDINWNWARCLLPGRDEDGRIRVREALVDGMPYGKNEYFSRPTERDFFYVTARPRAPSTADPAK